MKKVLSILLCLTLLFSLCACGKEKTKSSENEKISLQFETQESIKNILSLLNGYWVDFNSGPYSYYGCEFNDKNKTVKFFLYPGSYSVGNIVNAIKLEENKYEITVLFPEVDSEIDYSPEREVKYTIYMDLSKKELFFTSEDKIYSYVCNDENTLNVVLEQKIESPLSDESSVDYQSPKIVGYKTKNAEAIQQEDGTWKFKSVCPWCGDSSLSGAMVDSFIEFTAYCWHSDCFGMEGYKYSIKPIYE